MILRNDELDNRIRDADARYGPFASTHEAMGVALEEWNELCLAIHMNNLNAVREEALDLAAVCIRLAESMDNQSTRNRSVK